MAFPQVLGTANSAQSVDATSHSVALPAGVQAGDLLVAVFSTSVSATPSWPEGWVVAWSDALHSCAYKVADGSEGSSITVTTGSVRSAHHVYRIVDFDGGTPLSASGTSSAASGAPDPPNLDVGVAADYLWIAMTGDGNVPIGAAPANYSDKVDSPIGQVVFNGSARRELNASSENPGTFSAPTNRPWVAATIAIHPAEENDITDSGTVAAAASHSASDSLSDSASSASAVASAGAESFADAGTPVVVIAHAGAEMIADSGASTQSAAHEGALGLPRRIQVSWAQLDFPAFSTADLARDGTVEASALHDADEALAEDQESAGEVENPSAEAIYDEAANVAVIAVEGDEQAAYLEAGVATAVSAHEGAEALADAGDSDQLAVYGAAEAIADGGSSGSAQDPSGDASLADSTALLVESLHSGEDALADEGTSIAVVNNGVSDAFDEGDNEVGVAHAGEEALADSGRADAAAAAEGDDAIGDSGLSLTFTHHLYEFFVDPITEAALNTVVIVTTGKDHIAGSDTSEATIVLTAAEAIYDEGENVAVVVIPFIAAHELDGENVSIQVHEGEHSFVAVGTSESVAEHSGDDAIADSGETISVSLHGFEVGAHDLSGTVEVGVTHTGVETVIDTTTNTVTIDFPSSEAVRDATTSAVTITHEGAADVLMSNTALVGVAHSGSAAILDTGGTIVHIDLRQGIPIKKGTADVYAIQSNQTEIGAVLDEAALDADSGGETAIQIRTGTASVGVAPPSRARIGV